MTFLVLSRDLTTPVIALGCFVVASTLLWFTNLLDGWSKVILLIVIAVLSLAGLSFLVH